MPLEPDDTVCYCFHVSLRKIETFCRVAQPAVASQISDCLSAGTGCGWCVPMLKVIHRRALPEMAAPWWKEDPTRSTRDDPNADSTTYQSGRAAYLSQRAKSPKMDDLDRAKPPDND